MLILPSSGHFRPEGQESGQWLFETPRLGTPYSPSDRPIQRALKYRDLTQESAKKVQDHGLSHKDAAAKGGDFHSWSCRALASKHWSDIYIMPHPDSRRPIVLPPPSIHLSNKYSQRLARTVPILSTRLRPDSSAFSMRPCVPTPSHSASSWHPPSYRASGLHNQRATFPTAAWPLSRRILHTNRVMILLAQTRSAVRQARGVRQMGCV